HSQQVMMLASMLAAVAALGPALSVRRSGITGLISLLILLAADGWLLGAIRPMPGLVIAYGRFTAAVQGQAGDIVFSGEGLHSSVARARLPNGRPGYHNAGKIQASREPQDMRLQRMLGHLTTLVPSRARSVLVIGCGAGGTAGARSTAPLGG